MNLILKLTASILVCMSFMGCIYAKSHIEFDTTSYNKYICEIKKEIFSNPKFQAIRYFLEYNHKFNDSTKLNFVIVPHAYFQFFDEKIIFEIYTDKFPDYIMIYDHDSCICNFIYSDARYDNYYRIWNNQSKIKYSLIPRYIFCLEKQSTYMSVSGNLINMFDISYFNDIKHQNCETININSKEQIQLLYDKLKQKYLNLYD